MTEYEALSVDPYIHGSSSHGRCEVPGGSTPLQPPNEVEIDRVSPLKSDGLAIVTRAAEVRLLQFQKGDEIQFEFLLSRHLVVFFPDGIFGEVEWGGEAWNNRSTSSSPRTIAFNPSREYLRLKVREVKHGFRALLLLVEPDSLHSLYDGSDNGLSSTLQQMIDVKAEEVAHTLRKIHEELSCPGPYTAPYVHALVLLALAGLMRRLSSQESPRRSMRAKGGLPSWRLKRALELLEFSLSESLTLTELARALKLHPTSFCRGFRESTGLTPHRYLLLCRVNRAKEMMKDPDCTLTEIALVCGFNSSSQFSVVFRRLEGVSPRSFRRSI